MVKPLLFFRPVRRLGCWWVINKTSSLKPGQLIQSAPDVWCWSYKPPAWKWQPFMSHHEFLSKMLKLSQNLAINHQELLLEPPRYPGDFRGNCKLQFLLFSWFVGSSSMQPDTKLALIQQDLCPAGHIVFCQLQSEGLDRERGQGCRSLQSSWHAITILQRRWQQ